MTIVMLVLHAAAYFMIHVALVSMSDAPLSEQFNRENVYYCIFLIGQR